VTLYDLHSAINVERAIGQVVQKDKIQPRIIIIDTLARNFGGGNENSTEDMSQFVAHIDKHLRDRFNATVLLVHHTGHGSAERGRGSRALKAAVDTD
jgi:putative DNA primase/helicase